MAHRKRESKKAREAALRNLEHARKARRGKKR